MSLCAGQESTVLHANGTASKVAYDGEKPSICSQLEPEARYSHGMISINRGRQVFLFGGCRGDGTRLQDVFLLDTARAGRGQEDGDNPMEGEGKYDIGEDTVQVRVGLHIRKNIATSKSEVMLRDVTVEARSVLSLGWSP